MLAEVLFGEEQKKIFCRNCKKELKKEWKSCPYCSAPTVTSDIDSAILPCPIDVKNKQPQIPKENIVQTIINENNEIRKTGTLIKQILTNFDGKEIKVEHYSISNSLAPLMLYVDKQLIGKNDKPTAPFRGALNIDEKYQFSFGERNIQIFSKIGGLFSFKTKICIDGEYIAGDRF